VRNITRTYPTYSFISTVYNNANSITKTLESIVNAIKKAEVLSEIVVIDNYSNDCTYDLLTKKSKQALNSNISSFIVMRRKCNRGLGRQIALHMSSGMFIITFDGDTIYDSYNLSKVLKLYYNLFAGKVLLVNEPGFIGIIPRMLCTKIGFRDLNYSEDIDFLARLLSIVDKSKIVSLPISLARNEEVVGVRERRYATGLKYLIRKIGNYVDNVISYGLNTKKTLIHSRYIWGNKLYKAFLMAYLNTLIYHSPLRMRVTSALTQNNVPAPILIDNLYLETLIEPNTFKQLLGEDTLINSFIKDVSHLRSREIVLLSQKALLNAMKYRS